jgi:cobalt-zinc-cadmium efflux system outer membrane protein
MRTLPFAGAALAVAAALAGCAGYQPSTLPAADGLLHDVDRIAVDSATLPIAPLRTHRFDPSDGLDMTEVAMLAVANSPDLKALRADAGVTRAQAFSAGLLPDPQLALSGDHMLHPIPGSTNAFSAGLAVDVSALLARSAIRAAGEAEGRKTNLELLWQEWQTVAKARLLFVKLQAIARAQSVLASYRENVGARLADATRAADQGLITREATTPLLTAVQDAARQWSDLERQRNQSRHDLNALLGVAPEVALVLVGDSDAATPDAAQVGAAIADAGRRRPDLLALQAGFEAQDDRYRGALRAQFPAITVGPTRARDTSNVNTIGFSLGITLPLFNRNRGNIAIESATRDKLRQDYQQRLDATASESHRLLEEQAILRRQLAGIAESMPALDSAAQHAGQAFQARNIDALTLTNIEGALLARRLERINADAALQEQAIALQALLGAAADVTAVPDAPDAPDAPTHREAAAPVPSSSNEVSPS